MTHSFNMDTRFVDLPFKINADGSVTVDQPDNANILTPGNWMLFAIDKEGVPSVAKTVHGRHRRAGAWSPPRRATQR